MNERSTTAYVNSQRLNYVSGEWIESSTGETFETSDPTNPNEVIATYPLSDAEDTKQAIKAASEASETWATTPGPERGRILSTAGTLLAERKDTLTKLLVREEGRPVARRPARFNGRSTSSTTTAGRPATSAGR